MINDEVKSCVFKCSEKISYQNSVEVVRELEPFESVLPSAWEKTSGSKEPSLEIHSNDVAAVMNFM